MSKLYCGNSDCGEYLGSLGADRCVHCGWIDPDVLEAAATVTNPLLQRIAELERQLEEARKQALEEAAKVCDDIRSPLGYSAEKEDWIRGTDDCAAAIRALKGAKE